MKNNLLVILALCVFFLSSCKKEDSTPVGITMEWTLGDLLDSTKDISENLQEFDSQTSNSLSIEVTESSLCPTNGVEVIVESDGDELFKTMLNKSTYTVSIPQNSIITLKTALVDSGSDDIVCVWLGNIDLKASY